MKPITREWLKAAQKDLASCEKLSGDISTRYPGEFGLLPDGEPGIEESIGFYQFARNTFEKVNAVLVSDQGDS